MYIYVLLCVSNNDQSFNQSINRVDPNWPEKWWGPRTHSPGSNRTLLLVSNHSCELRGILLTRNDFWSTRGMCADYTAVQLSAAEVVETVFRVQRRTGDAQTQRAGQCLRLCLLLEPVSGDHTKAAQGNGWFPPSRIRFRSKLRKNYVHPWEFRKNFVAYVKNNVLRFRKFAVAVHPFI